MTPGDLLESWPASPEEVETPGPPQDRETKLRRMRTNAAANHREHERLRAVRALYRLLLDQGRYEVTDRPCP